MNKKKLLTLVALTAAVMPLSAQNAAGDAEYTFKPHAYIQLQGGAQYTLGETKFTDLLSPNVQGALGYQFKPWLGLRLSLSAWQSKGAFSGVKMADGTFGTKVYKYNYLAPNLDVMFNLSNVLCGWNPERTVNVSAFLGGGANVGWNNDEAVDLKNEGYNLSYVWSGKHFRGVARGGVAVDFRLSDRVSLGIEGNANMLIDKYNSKYGDNPDWYFNALAGIKINLGKTYKKKAATAPIRPVEQQPAPAPQPETKPVQQEVKAEKFERDVFFKINSSVISKEEKNKVKEFAAYLNEHPNAKVDVTGYADAGTGTDEVNRRISARRAESVKKMLVKEYGIDASRVNTSSKGSSIQPFAENDKNRVTICVAE